MVTIGVVGGAEVAITELAGGVVAMVVGLAVGAGVVVGGLDAVWIDSVLMVNVTPLSNVTVKLHDSKSPGCSGTG